MCVTIRIDVRDIEGDFKVVDKEKVIYIKVDGIIVYDSNTKHKEKTKS